VPTAQNLKINSKEATMKKASLLVLTLLAVVLSASAQTNPAFIESIADHGFIEFTVVGLIGSFACWR